MTVKLQAVPMMDKPEIEAMKNVLDSRKPARVLEWGSGGSTLYWPKVFPKIEWVSIEHNQKYANAIKDKLPSNVKLFVKPFPAYHDIEVSEFGKFDLIIVDGRQRVRCLSQARGLLNEGGAVLLHDSGRQRYAPAREFYKTITVLSPPKKEKDPRGLWMLTDPQTGKVTAKQGVIYMCWGDPATRQADASIVSLRRVCPDMPVMVVGDAAAVNHFKKRAKVLTHLCKVEPFKNDTSFGFLAGRIKPLLAGISPFEFTLYVDAETEFKTSPQVGFDLLNKWDFVVAEAELRSLAMTHPSNHTEADSTAKWLGTPHILYHNSGMLFWRKNERTAKLFDLWYEEWLKYEGWDEQVALLRALTKSDVMFLNVPFTWNCRGPQQSFLLYHRFASLAARKFKTGRPFTRPPKLRPGTITGPLVTVEISPGRLVKCYHGDEEKVRAMYKLQLRGNG